MPEPSDLPRVAVLGQGSIGRRHAGTLLELGCPVVAWDPAPGAVHADGAAQAATAEDAVAEADAVVVASPTSHHAAQAALALEAGKPVLVEKPLALDAAQAAPLVDRALADGALLAVAMNLRFHPGPRAVHEAVASGRVGRPLVGSFSFGSHLPDWRPGTDYRESYSARRKLGGGVLLDVIHEIDYATWVLGPAVEVSAWLGTVSNLEIDVEDVALLHLGLASGASASLELDYLDRSYRRGCRIVGSEASVEWSWTEQRVLVLGPGGAVEEVAAPSDVAPSYRAEVERFLAAVTGGDGSDLVSGADGLRALELVDAARESAAAGRRVALGA